MNWRKTMGTISMFVLLLALLPVLGLAQDGDVAVGADKIEAELLEQFNVEGAVDFVVVFAKQADLSPAYGMDWDARGEFVYNTLKEVAAQSQVDAKAYLDGQGLDYHTFIAGNELYVWAGDLEAATGLAALPEVGYIQATRTAYIDPIIEDASSTPDSPDALAWGILDVHADQFWAAFGMQGDGIVVANIDTGVQYDHPALDQAYKCWPDASDPACWEDPSNICGGSMCDNNGHGTHTMGTMVADDDPALTWQAGMAPNAQWIACKGCESSSCSSFALDACFDWVLAPAGDPANRPHIVNNSWGSAGCNPAWLADVQALQAAGIFPAFSAGNSSGCGSMGSPGDFQESFASTGHNSSRVHSYAQGPSCYGHDPYTKPNISAPAVSVCSSIPGNGWSCGYSGTSMASPHSAGAVALLWSCNPSLIGQMNMTFEALQNNTDPPDPANPACGVPPDNEGTYEDGYGYLNVYQAGLAYCGGANVGWLEGHVTETVPPYDPIPGANVSAVPSAQDGSGIEAVTDPNGYYTMTLLVGTYDVTASKNGYNPETVTGVPIVSGTVTVQDFGLDFLGQWIEVSLPDPPPMQYNRFDGVFNPHDGLIYFLSGRTGGASHDNNIWTYDPATNTYADTGDDMLFNIANYTTALIEDDGTGRGPAMYVIGGYDAVLAVNHDHVQRYYPQSGIVEEVTTDPYPDTTPTLVPVGAGGSAVVNDKIYVFGGWDSAIPYFSAKTWEFDPQAAAGSKWTEITTATLNPARSYINTAVQGNLIYAMGGIDAYTGGDLTPVDTVEVFDPANPAAGWVPLTSMPIATGEGRGFGFQDDTLGLNQPPGKIYVAGGGDWPDESAEAMEYDVATDTWNQAFPDLVTARRNHAGVYVSTCTPDPQDGLPGMWVFGGRVGGSDEPPYGLPEFYPLPCPGPAPDLEITKDTDVVEAYGGQLVTYTLAYTNSGDLSAIGTLITDVLPVEVDYVSSDPAGTYDPVNHEVLWTVDIISGTSDTIDLVVEVSSTVRPGNIFVNAVAMQWGTQPPIGDPSPPIEVICPPGVPTANFSWFPITVYTDTVVQFNDTSTGNIVDWLWETSDGYSSTDQNPTHTFVATGTYAVSLTVTTDIGCVDSTTKNLDVIEKPDAFYIYLPMVIKQ